MCAICMRMFFVLLVGVISLVLYYRHYIIVFQIFYFIFIRLFCNYLFVVPAQLCNAEGQMVKAKVYDALQLQIWSLLPSFCNHATDVKEVSLNGFFFTVL